MAGAVTHVFLILWVSSSLSTSLIAPLVGGALVIVALGGAALRISLWATQDSQPGLEWEEAHESAED